MARVLFKLLIAFALGIGVLGMEVYFPTTYVEQADLGENRATLLFLPPTTRGKNCASREEEDCGRD